MLVIASLPVSRSIATFVDSKFSASIPKNPVFFASAVLSWAKLVGFLLTFTRSSRLSSVC